MIKLSKFKAFLFKKWKYFLFLFIFSIATYFAFFLIMRNFTISGASDAFFINSALFIGVGILQIIGNYGTFDLLAYSTSKFIDSYRHEAHYKEGFSLLDYKESKVEKRNGNRWNFIFYEFIGVLYLIGAIVGWFLI